MKYSTKPNRGMAATDKKRQPRFKTKPVVEETEEEKSGLMRLNKYLAHQGVATRRGADELIAKGQVMVNDKIAYLGAKITPTDKIELVSNKSAKKGGTRYNYYAYNKPAGQGVGNQSYEKGFYENLKGKHLFPADQLDKRDSGLIIVTNDGRLTTRLLNPEFEVEKEFLVTTRNNIHENFREKIKSGITVDGHVILPKKVKVLGDKTIIISIDGFGRHEIQAMFAVLFNDIASLERTAVANIKLGKQAYSTFREITGTELDEFLEILKIPKQ
ncbi:MAG: pseudouridine synthase [bacterium]